MTSLRDAFQALAACERCGKSTAVRANRYGQPDYTNVLVTTHCTCGGGPVERMLIQKSARRGVNADDAYFAARISLEAYRGK